MSILFKAFSNLKSGEYDASLALLEEFIDEFSGENYFTELIGDIYFLQLKYKKAAVVYNGLLNTDNKERVLFKSFLLHLYDLNLLEALACIKTLHQDFKKVSY